MKINTKKILCLVGVLILVLFLKGSPKLQFYTDVYAWYPDGKIKKISPGDGIYFQPCIHPEGTHVVYYGFEKVNHGHATGYSVSWIESNLILPPLFWIEMHTQNFVFKSVRQAEEEAIRRRAGMVEKLSFTMI
jgi:hypothetical protein